MAYILFAMVLSAIDAHAYSPHQRWILKDNRLHYKLDQLYCASVRNDDFVSGADIILWNCEEGASEWVYDGSYLKLKADPNYCMAVREAKAGDGSDIILWPCGDTEGQLWDFSSEHIKFKHEPKYWVSIRGNVIQDGSDLILWQGGSVGNKWKIGDRVIKLKADPRFCIGSRGNKKWEGPNGILGPCERSKRQGDFHIKNGLIQSLDDPKYCLSVREGDYKDNQDVIMWTCDANDADHMWEMDAAGHIKCKAHPEFCLMVAEPLGRGGFLGKVSNTGGPHLKIHGCGFHEEEGAMMAHSRGFLESNTKGGEEQAWVYHEGKLRLKVDMRYCATSSEGKVGNGHNIILWHCQDDAGSTQSRWELKGKHIVLAQDPRYCMSVREGLAGDGSDVILWECATEDNAHSAWTMSPKMISGTQDVKDIDTIKYAAHPKFVLSVRSNLIEDGTPLIIWSGYDNAFAWVIDGALIRLKADPNLCLSVREGKAGDGSDLILWECDVDESANRWKISDGTVRLADNDKYCASVREAKVYDATSFILWTCGDATAQTMIIEDERFRIKRNPAYCMSVEEGRAGYGSNVVVWSCDKQDKKRADEL